MAQDKLFDDFKGISKEEWIKKIESDLKGKPYSELCSTTSAGIEIEPVFTSEDLPNVLNEPPGSGTYRRSSKTTSNEWVIDEAFCLTPDSNKNQKNIQSLLNAGLTGITLCGETQSTDLKGIMPQYITLGFCDYKSLDKLLLEIENALGNKPNSYSLHLNYDPIGRACVSGKFDKKELSEGINSIFKYQHFQNTRWFTASGTQYHNAGGNAVSELAFTLAHAHEYLVFCIENGLNIDQASAQIKLDLACGADYFQELAKLRAMRILWAKLIETYSPRHSCSKSAYIHAHSSQFYSTVYDPYVNMLRGTTQGMSAALGGADVIRILPYNTAWKEGSSFANRIARNVQLLLQEESHFNQVIDPAGGSYFIEYLTEQLSQKAWKKFQKIEQKGGFIGLMTSGNLARELGEDLDVQLENLNKGQTKILGVTLYPNPMDKMLEELQEYSPQTQDTEPEFDSVKLVRLTEKIEQERMQKELHQNSKTKEADL